MVVVLIVLIMAVLIVWVYDDGSSYCVDSGGVDGVGFMMVVVLVVLMMVVLMMWG